MKRATPDHPKTKHLMAILGIKRWEAVGILESVWHYAQQYAKRGDIGKWSDVEIAAHIEYKGDAGQLMEALADAKWLDRCAVHRYVIHHWAEHCDQTVSRSEEVKSHGFASVTPVDASMQLANASAQLANASQPSLALPSLAKPSQAKEEEPPIVPLEKGDVPEKPKQISASDVEAIYKAYPKHVGRDAAIKAIRKAFARLSADPKMTQPASHLLAKTHQYAQARKTEDKQFTPHPATWFNRGSYDDDPECWKDGNGKHDTDKPWRHHGMPPADQLDGLVVPPFNPGAPADASG